MYSGSSLPVPRTNGGRHLGFIEQKAEHLNGAQLGRFVGVALWLGVQCHLGGRREGRSNKVSGNEIEMFFVFFGTPFPEIPLIKFALWALFTPLHWCRRQNSHLVWKYLEMAKWLEKGENCWT